MSAPQKEIWTQEMDNILIDAFLHQQNEGNKDNGSYTLTTDVNITKELADKFQRYFQKKTVKKRRKFVRKKITSVTIFSKGTTEEVTLDS
jgi:hypothetical protein